jgi:parallel beta-helix repeat protein
MLTLDSDADVGPSRELHEVDTPSYITRTPPSFDCLQLNYTSGPVYYYWRIPDDYGDDFFNERFTMPVNGYLTKAFLSFYDNYPEFNNTDGVDVIVWNSDGLYPATELGRVHIPPAQMSYFPIEQEVDLTPLGPLYFSAGEDFHIGYTVVNQCDNSVGIVSDDGSGPILNRSSENSSGMWGTILQDWGIDVDFFITAEVCTDGSTGFVFIDKNKNGTHDPGEWNGTSIQAAVDNAMDGDIIYAWNGSYYENNIVVDKELTIIGNTTVSGPSRPTQQNDSCVYFTDKGFIITENYVNISGFYISGSGGPPCGAVFINNSDHCNISGNLMMNDYDGIYLNNSHYNAIYNNSIFYTEIGIWMKNNSSHNTIAKNFIHNNSFGIWYQASMGSGCWNTISHNNISNNYNDGIRMDHTDNETITFNDLYGNGYHPKTDEPIRIGGSAIYFDHVVDSTIANNTIHGLLGIQLVECLNITVNDNNLSGYSTDLPPLADGTYEIYLKEGSEWTLVDKLYLTRSYIPEYIPLPYSAAGTYQVRIVQYGGSAAHLDYIAIKDRTGRVGPTSARVVGGETVMQKVSDEDRDVADIWEKTVEFSWDGIAGRPTLVVLANQEYPVRAYMPLLTPTVMHPDRMEEYVLGDNGDIVIDGNPDNLGVPDFTSYWKPATGHPHGDTFVWLRCDGEYLYATMEITSDNTYDETGWGALYIHADGKLHEFQINAADNTYGVAGFVYTDTVAYQHIIYEFQIPLAEIGAAAGDTIRLGYGAYGTEAAPGNVGILIESHHDSGPGFNHVSGDIESTIAGNTIQAFETGVYLTFSRNVTIIGNTIMNNTYNGVKTYGLCEYITIVNNTIIENGLNPSCDNGGIILYQTDSCLIENNYFTEDIGGAINLCDNDNYIVIRGNTIESNCGELHGMSIKNYCSNNTVENNLITNNTGPGIRLDNNLYFTVIRNNTITENDFAGITTGIDVYNTIIDNNYIAGHRVPVPALQADYGIRLYYCNHTAITNNTITDNDIGIYVYGGTYEENGGYRGYIWNTDTEIHWNNIYGNLQYGLWYDMDWDWGGMLAPPYPFINATYNWWGAVNGPDSHMPVLGYMDDPITETEANGDGDYIHSGDEMIDENIHFDPWLGFGRMLYEGWNMISPTFIEGVYDAADLADYINGGNKGPGRELLCTVVTRWDATMHMYQSYVVGFGGNFALENGSGYMVFMTEDMNMPIYGAVLEPEINQTLIAGYNLIGWPYPWAIAASELAENISYSVKIAFLDAETQTWLPEYIVGLPIPWDFDVQMSEGVFVFVSDETSYAWTGMPALP